MGRARPSVGDRRPGPAVRLPSKPAGLGLRRRQVRLDERPGTTVPGCARDERPEPIEPRPAASSARASLWRADGGEPGPRDPRTHRSRPPGPATRTPPIGRPRDPGRVRRPRSDRRASVRPGEVGDGEPGPAVKADPERQLLGEPMAWSKRPCSMATRTRSWTTIAGEREPSPRTRCVTLMASSSRPTR